MTGVKHAFTSGKADDADATLVNPSDWNDEHEPNLTTKGDIIVRGASAGLRLGVGSDDEALVAKASVSAGMNWQAVILASLLTTRGDIIYRNATVPARLAKGTSGYVLKQGANDPAWAICPTKDLVTTAGDVLYATAADVLARLAIGTAGQVLATNSGATAPEWIAAPAGHQVIRKAAAETINNSDTLQDDDDFTFAIAANEIWAVWMTIHLTEIHSTADFKFTWTLPASASMLAEAIMEPSGGIQTNSYKNVGTTPGTAITMLTDTAGATALRIMALLRNAGNAGTATFQWAQNTAHASNLTLAVDSFMVAHKI